MQTKRWVDNDPVLKQIFRGYMPTEQDFISDKILPTINVKQKRGQIPKTVDTAQDFLRVQNNLVISDAGHPEITMEVTKADAWNTVARGAQMRVTKDDGEFYAENGVDWKTGMKKARNMRTMALKTFRMMSRDYALSQYLFNATNITQNTTLSGTAQFNDFTNSDPLAVFRTARMTIESNAHIDPKNLEAIIPYPIFEYLIDHPKIKQTHANGGTIQVDSLTKEQLKKALRLKEIHIPRVKYETANLGQTSSLSRIWGNFILVYYVNRSPNPMEWQRSLGFNFSLRDVVMDWWETISPKDTQFVRFTEEYDQLILDANAAYLIVDPIESSLFI